MKYKYSIIFHFNLISMWRVMEGRYLVGRGRGLSIDNYIHYGINHWQDIPYIIVLYVLLFWKIFHFIV